MNNTKRRDHKGRILRTGESQRTDGRYAFKYTDLNGKPRFVYSWKLESTDKLPTGKRNDLSLREKQKQIQKDLDDEIVPNGGNLTVLQLVKKYVLQKKKVKPKTKDGYKTVINFLLKDPFGQMRIDKIKQSDAKEWLIKLQNEYHKGYSSIQTIRGVLRPAFRMAFDDDLIRKNPFDFPILDVVIDDSIKREAISEKQERAFLDFIKNDKHFSKYYEGIFILFKTGMRISEFVCLTVSDINFNERTINVEYQLQRNQDMAYTIIDLKTEKSARVLPMSDEVYECFKSIIGNRPKYKIEPMIQGKTKFLYLDKNGNPLVALHWEKYFEHICAKYNKIYKEPLPKITPHVCRHTYCTNMARSGMNPATLQYLMGHADISTTYNVYTHLKVDDAKRELAKLQKQKKTKSA